MQLDWQDVFNALALLLIIEGLLPFLSPSSMKNIYQKLHESSDKDLRMAGFIGMIVGLLLLYLV